MDKATPDVAKDVTMPNGPRGSGPVTIPAVHEGVKISVVPSKVKSSLNGDPLRVAIEITCDPDKLKPSENPPQKRIVLILDVSYSMGPYLEDLKTSAGHVISTYCSDPDEALVVTFSATGRVAHPLCATTTDGRASLVNVINGLHTDNDTCASAGLSVAFENMPNDDVQTLVFFFSDGQFNRGITDPDGLRALMTQLIGSRPIVVSVIALSPNPSVEQMEAVMSEGAKFTYAKTGQQLLGAFTDSASLSRDVFFANAAFTVSDATRMKAPIRLGAVEAKKTHTVDITAVPQKSTGRFPAAEFVVHLGGQRITQELELEYVDGDPPPEPLPQVFQEADLMSQCQREFARVAANPALAPQRLAELSHASRTCPGSSIAAQIERESLSLLAASEHARKSRAEAKSFTLHTASVTQRVKRSF